MPMDDQTTKNFLEALPGIVGSLIALPFLKGTWPMRVSMAVGGALLSYYGTATAVTLLKAPDAEGLVGFLIGLFGMAIVAKLYELINSIDTKVMFLMVVDWLKGWLPKRGG